MILKIKAYILSYKFNKMSELALKTLNRAKAELAAKKQAYKTTIAILHQLRINIAIKEKTIGLLEEVYAEAISEETEELVKSIIAESNNILARNQTKSSPSSPSP